MNTSLEAKILTTQLPGGLTLLMQPMPWLRTAAFSLAIPGGIQAEPDDKHGLASMTCEMVQRGAGQHSSRDLVAIQDNLGMDRSGGASTPRVSFGAAMPADSLREAIGVYRDIVREPHLPEDQLDDARMMMVQELRAIQDEPTQRVMRRLRELHYGPKLGRSPHGTMESLESIQIQDVQNFYQQQYGAEGAILGIAGKIDPDQVTQWVQEAFGDWTGASQEPEHPIQTVHTHEHIDSPSSQTHIGFAFGSIPYGHDDYFKMRAAIGILSDGMSSRLFDRVREKRGLCYSVGASCHSLKQGGGVFGYAGTKPERAQETLDVTLHEIEHLSDDLEQAELDRWKVRIQSGLIMEQESSASRAASLVSDFYQRGRAISTEELERDIESLQLDEVRDYWQDNLPRQFEFVTLGPEKLKTPTNH